MVALLVQNGELIGSSQEGYYYITEQDDYQIAKAEIISRIDKLRQRLNGLEKGWEANQVPPTFLIKFCMCSFT